MRSVSTIKVSKPLLDTPTPPRKPINNNRRIESAHVLVALANDRQARVRDVAQAVGITERAVMLILADLEKQGIVERVRVGRRNRYELHLDAALRHPLEAHRTVGELIHLVGASAPSASGRQVRNR